MYCPRCGQSRTHEQTRFCSRCGFLMTELKEFVRFGGQMPRRAIEPDPGLVSPKIRGLKQGGIMFLSGMIIVPLLAILLDGILGVEPVLAGVAALVLFLGGFLRMVYALLFQPNIRTSPDQAGFFSSLKQIFLSSESVSAQNPKPLNEPVFTDFPNASMNWRDTSDLEYTARNDISTTTLDRK